MIKTFRIHATVDLKKMLPTNITKEGLINYSTLKRKKKWRNNRRLMKKFIKNYHKYIPYWVRCAWKNLPFEIKAMNEIMYEEDRRLLTLIDNEGKK